MGLEEMKGAARLSLEVFMPLQGDHWGDRAELTHSTFRNFRQRREETIKQMETLGCQLSPTVHKRVEFVLCDDDALTSETKHVRKAAKYKIPLVSIQYVEECVQLGKKLRPEDFDKTRRISGLQLEQE